MLEKNVLGVFLDTETNGLNFLRHHLVEIAFKIVDLKSGQVLDTYEAVVYQPEDVWKNSDPSSLLFNGFTYDEVQHGKKSGDVALEITNILQKNKIHRDTSVFICQNPSFDRAFFSKLIDSDIQEKLKWPYHWLDLASMYWAESMRQDDPSKLPWATGFSKDRIASAYHLPSEQTPHRAMNGVNHLLQCYEKVIGFKM